MHPERVHGIDACARVGVLIPLEGIVHQGIIVRRCWCEWVLATGKGKRDPRVRLFIEKVVPEEILAEKFHLRESVY